MKKDRIIPVIAFQKCPFNYRLMEIKYKKTKEKRAETPDKNQTEITFVPFYKNISRH